MLNDYQFITRWRVQGSAEEVYALISNPADYPRWWPAVYLSCKETAPGDASGVGRTVQLHTKGWLPYTLRWQSRAVRAERPHVLAIRATGDFNGRGIWVIEPHGDCSNVTFHWQLRADKPVLRYLSPLLKPAFAANHRWAMQQGRKSLELELMRRHVTLEEELAHIPPPPSANTTSGYVLAGAGLGLLAAFAAVLCSRRRGRDWRPGTDN